MTRIVANMATYPARRAGLYESVHSIIPQVDYLNLCLNEYATVPSWITRESKIKPFIPNSDLKDTGKFIFACKADDDILLVDDDIVYPGDYVEQSLESRRQLQGDVGRSSVLGYHATIYRFPSAKRITADFLRKGHLIGEQIVRQKTTLPYFRSLAKPILVSQLGTGTVLMRGKHLPPHSYMRGSERRVDVRFSRWCLKAGLLQVALPRSESWMAKGGDDELSIYKTYTQRYPRAFTNEVFWLTLLMKIRGKHKI